MKIWRYDIYLNGALVDTTELSGIADLKFESAKHLGLAELHRVYQGESFDPVIHGTIITRGGEMPPCPLDKSTCRYRQAYHPGWNCTPRPTAFRIETISPQDRCGYMLKPNRIGGIPDDYNSCLYT